MKALVLAGGLGTRLRPLTLTRPKHLLPIANVPHIEHVLGLLQRHGFEDVVFLTSHLSEAFAGVIEKASRRGMRVQTTFEAEPLGTAGAFKNAQELLDDETFVAFNGDILTDLDLGAVVRWHEERSAEATIVLHEVEDPSAFGVVPTDESGRVLGFIEKPDRASAPTNLINAGTYVFEPSVLDRIPAGEVWSAEHQLFPQMVAEGAALFARADDAYWMDIGTPDKYRTANLDALEGRYGGWAAPDGVSIAPGAAVDPGAHVKLSSIGPDCTIAAGATVEESVLLAGARIETGARVVRSVLGARVVVGARAIVEDAALGDEETVPATA